MCFPIDKLPCISAFETEMWKATFKCAQKNPLGGRLLVVPIALESYVTELISLPTACLRNILKIAAILLRTEKVSGDCGKVPCLALKAIFFGVATCFIAPLYAMINTVALCAYFLLNPRQTAAKGVVLGNPLLHNPYLITLLDS